MFEYLTNYGIKKYDTNYTELDINDRLELQSQINDARKNYYKLLSLLDEVQQKYLLTSTKLSKRSKEIIQNNISIRSNNAFNSDDEYVALEVECQALKAGMNMINAQIDFCKNDLRILNSVFYNKF